MIFQSNWTQWIAGLALLACATAQADETPRPQPTFTSTVPRSVANGGDLGAELFVREWIPGDSRSHAGDGLGPVFNDSSCVACHNQGGIGGGGPASKNAEIATLSRHSSSRFAVPVASGPVTTFASPAPPAAAPQLNPAPPRPVAEPAPPTPASQPSPAEVQEKRRRRIAEARKQFETRQQAELAKLSKLHPGFRTAQSVVLHRFGTFGTYRAWRVALLKGQGRSGQQGNAPLRLVGVADLPPREQPKEKASPPATPAPRNPVSFHAPVLVQPVPQFAPSPGIGLSLGEEQRAVLADMNSQQLHTPFAAGHFQTLSVQRSTRNPIALFGSGEIDNISDEVIEAAAKRRFANYPDVSGRVSRLKNNRIGRFGWKAQIASLRDFTLTACAVELGLEVPGHPQGGIPQRPDYRPQGVDLTLDECNALVEYLRQLPRPAEATRVDAPHGEFLDAGRKMFERVGCAACHTPQLGDVAGIYSDLLLHDLGPGLTGAGNYEVFTPGSQPERQDNLVDADAGQPGKPAAKPKQRFGAEENEWRTPPLWGVRDSAPYMHDGRAETLEQAIALHGGEATKSAQMYFSLLPEERMQVLAMLRSLVAPAAAGPK